MVIEQDCLSLRPNSCEIWFL